MPDDIRQPPRGTAGRPPEAKPAASPPPASPPATSSTKQRLQPFSLRYTDPKEEDLFLIDRTERMFLQLSQCFLIIAFSCGWWLVGIAATQGTDKSGVDLDKARASSSQSQVTTLVLTGATALALLASVVLRQPFAQQTLGFRGGELIASLLCMVGQLYFTLVVWPSEERTDYQMAAGALGLGCTVAISHQAIPTRWCIKLCTDVLLVVTLMAYICTAEDVDFYLCSCISCLILAANLGGRSQEMSERTLYKRIEEERQLRLRLDAEARESDRGGNSAGHDGVREHVRRVSKQQDSGSSTKSTDTQLLFRQLALRGTVAEQFDEALQDAISLGHDEQWLIAKDQVVEFPAEVLGLGGQAKVIRGTFCHSPVAIKKYKIKANGEISRTVFNEMRILRHIRHPNIALFYGAVICESRERVDISLVLEHAGGLLFDSFLIHQFAKQVPEFADSFERTVVVRDVCRALIYLHAQRPCVVHGDIKPSNIMVEQRPGGPFAKLIDFGLSRTVSRSEKMGGGTAMYMAPEALKKGVCKARAALDMYSLGRVMQVVANGRQRKRSRSLGRKPTLHIEWNTSPWLVRQWAAAIAQCTHEDPNQRPEALEVYMGTFQSTFQTGMQRRMMRGIRATQGQGNLRYAMDMSHSAESGDGLARQRISSWHGDGNEAAKRRSGSRSNASQSGASSSSASAATAPASYMMGSVERVYLEVHGRSNSEVSGSSEVHSSVPSAKSAPTNYLGAGSRSRQRSAKPATIEALRHQLQREASRSGEPQGGSGDLRREAEARARSAGQEGGSGDLLREAISPYKDRNPYMPRDETNEDRSNASNASFSSFVHASSSSFASFASNTLSQRASGSGEGSLRVPAEVSSGGASKYEGSTQVSYRSHGRDGLQVVSRAPSNCSITEEKSERLREAVTCSL